MRNYLFNFIFFLSANAAHLRDGFHVYSAPKEYKEDIKVSYSSGIEDNWHVFKEILWHQTVLYINPFFILRVRDRIKDIVIFEEKNNTFIKTKKRLADIAMGGLEFHVHDHNKNFYLIGLMDKLYPKIKVWIHKNDVLSIYGNERTNSCIIVTVTMINLRHLENKLLHSLEVGNVMMLLI